jgi:hypothetical protein
VEFKAQNKELLKAAIESLGWKYEERENNYDDPD